MSVHDRKNLKSALESAILYLQKQGVEEARQDAWLLLEHVCGISHSTYFVHSEDEMPKEQQEQYEALVRKRGEHIPLQQLTGEAWFYGIPFFVNEHVLIPRQDTEILVEEALRGLPKDARILDLCTGSGCILISLLVTREDCTGIGADLSEKALQVAEKNGAQAGGRASFVKSNNGNPESCNRFTYTYENPIAGEGRFIHTYMHDGNPLPSFEGEPKLVAIEEDIDDFTNTLWNSLNDDNKVSLFVRYIDIATGEYETRIVNKNK